MIHLYCLAVQAGFYSDVVGWTLSPANRVRPPVGEKCYFHFYQLLHLAPNVNNPHVCIKILSLISHDSRTPRNSGTNFKLEGFFLPRHTVDLRPSKC